MSLESNLVNKYMALIVAESIKFLKIFLLVSTEVGERFTDFFALPEFGSCLTNKWTKLILEYFDFKKAFDVTVGLIFKKFKFVRDLFLQFEFYSSSINFCWRIMKSLTGNIIMY